MNMKTLFLLALSLLCLGNSILLSFRSNLTLGLILMYLLTATLFLYTRFYHRIDLFCQQGVGRLLKLLFFAGLLFFASLCLLMAKSAKPTVTYQEKALIVLGAGLRGDTVSDTLQRRLNAAVDYHQQNPTALLVVSGGQGPGETRTEASAMRDYLVQHGVAAKQILLEDRSVSTETNFLYSRALLAQHGVQTDDAIAFVTNDFHCYRSAQYAKRSGFTDVACLSVNTSPAVIFAATMREALAICALWVK